MSRKKQIEDLRAQLEQLRSDFVNSEGRRQDHVDRLDTVEVMIEGHDSTLDDTSEIVRSLPPVDTKLRTPTAFRTWSSKEFRPAVSRILVSISIHLLAPSATPIMFAEDSRK